MLSSSVKRKNIQQVEVISASLKEILQRRIQLKAVLISRKENFEQLLEGKVERFGIELIEQGAAIINGKLVQAKNKLGVILNLRMKALG